MEVGRRSGVSPRNGLPNGTDWELFQGADTPEENRTAALAQALEALADGKVASAAEMAANLLRAWPGTPAFNN